MKAYGPFFCFGWFRLVFGFGAGDEHFSSHVFLVMELGDGAFGLVDGEHFDKGEALGPLGGAIDDDFGMAHLSDASEQFGEVGFGDVVRQVSDVEASGGHFMLHDGARGFGLTRWAGLPGFARFPYFAWLPRFPWFPWFAGFTRLATAVAGL